MYTDTSDEKKENYPKVMENKLFLSVLLRTLIPSFTANVFGGPGSEGVLLCENFIFTNGPGFCMMLAMLKWGKSLY